ncbi:hypothetical protein L6164_016885 [Bauhinia variegata]|uniref:Uncharacterized protein n=1 Tax=Bauhinia variegata TaxID=167791 RepID=A0ACB9N7B6_BAUVA|nr:hypothetical protein L6164_016885 [Bauhinia variegata]
MSEIVKSYPHIKCINFDLPHVVADASKYEGVTHVGGDMFQAISKADAVFMKWVMHDWSDENGVKILKKCKEAIPEQTGKVIIVDFVLKPEGDGIFDDTAFVFDLLMIAHASGGRERTELEWKKILRSSFFSVTFVFNVHSSSIHVHHSFYPLLTSRGCLKFASTVTSHSKMQADSGWTR